MRYLSRIFTIRGWMRPLLLFIVPSSDEKLESMETGKWPVECKSLVYRWITACARNGAWLDGNRALVEAQSGVSWRAIGR